MIRLDKFICDHTAHTRSTVKKALRGGEVSVNAVPVRDGAFKIDPVRDAVTVGGERIVYQPFVYLMMNKPQGVVSATRDGKEKTVLDLLDDRFSHRALFPAGRLDKDTTGFVLLTDDGAFAHRILSPKNHIPKTYLAETDKPITENAVRAFEAGAVLEDGTVCLKASLSILSERLGKVVICEGMYHQIKRMFLSCGLTVTALTRTRMGALDLDKTLAPGAYRELNPDEVALISRQEPPENSKKIHTF